MSAPTVVAADALIPDFCRWRPLLLLAFILELVAIVLTLGIGTSMFTALMGSRALLTLMYGGKRKINKLAIG